MYVRMQNTYPFDWSHEGSPSFLCAAWPGVAINLGLAGNAGGTHMDWLDDSGIFNLVAPYGVYSGGDVALLSLGMRLLFHGSVLSYKVMEVQGVRNSIDIFYHKSVFDARERVYREHGIEKSYA
jgi:hypothetical protein